MRGVVAGLGAIGVLLLRTGVSDGWRVASAGAIGVVTVDLVYATVAVLAGTTVSRVLAGHERQVRLVGAAVLASIALTGLARLVRDLWSARLTPGRDPDPVPGRAPGWPSARPGATLLRFVGLTAINPLTAVYFAVLAAGLAERLAEPAERVAFVLGIGAASAAWQLGLAALGSAAGRGAGPRARLALGSAGDVVVLVLAVAVALA